MPQEHFDRLPEETRDATVALIKEVQEMLGTAMHSMPILDRERQKALGLLSSIIRRSVVW